MFSFEFRAEGGKVGTLTVLLESATASTDVFLVWNKGI